MTLIRAMCISLTRSNRAIALEGMEGFRTYGLGRAPFEDKQGRQWNNGYPWGFS